MPASFDVSRPREILVYVVLAVILLGYGVSIAGNLELYPFSAFPMFSKSRADHTEFSRVSWAGVHDGREIFFDKSTLKAFTKTKKLPLERYLKRRMKSPGSGEALLAEILTLHDVWRLEQDRPVPRLDGLRVYQDRYVLDPQGRNADRPDERRLLIEHHRERAS